MSVQPWARNETLHDWMKALKQPLATPDKPKKKKFLAKAKRWKNLSIHRGKQPLISNYFEACAYPDVALGEGQGTRTRILRNPQTTLRKVRSTVVSLSGKVQET